MALDIQSPSPTREFLGLKYNNQTGQDLKSRLVMNLLSLPE